MLTSFCAWRDHRLMRSSLQVRVLILLSASVNVGLWLFAPSSLTARLEEATGQSTFQVVFLTLVLLGWIDVLINDVLPEGVTARTLLKHRHLMYAVIGAAYLIKAFVGVSAGAGATGVTGVTGVSVVLFSFLGTAGVCVWYVFTEVIGTHHA